ncbi:MAG: lysophospholipid acyltransferase family protein [Phycisphaerales bacterium]|nr:lysophospholipid acyltransferase family protein [Phycisphaerales bacterium]
MSHAPADLNPFRLSLEQRGPLVRGVRPVLEAVLRFPAMNRIYREIHSTTDDRHFSDRTLDALGVELQFTLGDLSRIPATGPVVLIANHPIGGIDGLAMLAIMRRVRADSRMIGNYMMSIIPDLREIYLFVDPFGGEAAVRRNLATMRQAMQWLRDGHMLASFPSGEVASFQLRQRRIVEPQWNDSIARMILKTGAPVVPIHFEGRNSTLFHAAGVVHPRLRTLMLPTEMLRRRGRALQVRIGKLIPFEQIKRHGSPESITEYLRLRVSLLGQQEGKAAARTDAARPGAVSHAPIVEPAPPERLAEDVAALSGEHELVLQDQLRVYCAPAEMIPHCLQEIGRLREIAFRAVGEGTGRPTDLDRFDRHYLHLFVWDQARSRILGAYRVGLTDQIVPVHGIEGLYTHTLFRFGRRLLEQIDPCVELGRSFIHPEAQRATAPLMLLWKGIGQFLIRNPRYTGLIGPVSISAEYSTMSRLLLMAFLRMHKYLPQLGDLIKPRNPPRQMPPREWETQRMSTVVSDLDEVDSLVRELEADGKPMPVLLRQYLGLNAALLGFNVDSQFGNVIDGLMFVDVLKIDRRIMRRFLGVEGLERYLGAQAALA